MVDYLEPNDAQTSATFLGLVNGWTGNYGLSIESNNDDWFQFETADTGGSSDQVSIGFEDDLGDLDLALYDAQGTFLSSSTSVSDFESVSLSGRPAGTYYARVYGWSGASNPDYDLTITAPFDSGGSSSDDEYEDNDTRETAADLGSVTALAEYENLVIESEDDDWFTFTTSGTGGADAQVQLDFIHTNGDLDMVLYDANQNWLGSSTGVSNQETISLAGRPAGTYSLWVYGFAGASNPNYTLTIDPQVQSESDDDYEDNDSRETAADLGSVTALAEYENLVIESEDDDWFTFTTSGMGGAGAEVRLDFLHSLGDVDMALYDANGNWVGGSGSTSDSESISLEDRPAGTYYVEVYGWAGASNPDYTLTIDPRTGGGDGSDDSYEENDSLDEAFDLGTLRVWNDYYDLVVLSEDDDWFQFTVPEGERLDWIEIGFLDDNGDLDLQLYDDSGTLLNGSYGTWDYEYISGYEEDWGPGTYNVRVYGYAGDGNPSYDLSISTFPTNDSTDPSDDRYEENDSFNGAASLGLVQGYNDYDDDELALYDDDWFSFEIDDQGGYGDEVAIEFDGWQADLDMVLYDATENYIGGSYSVGDEESVSLTGLDAGIYYVHIYGFGGDTISDYNLIIDAPSSSGDTGGNDEFEPNDSQETAWLLESLSRSYNGVIADDEEGNSDSDWFRFDLASTGFYGHEVRIDFLDSFGDLDLQLYDENGLIGGSYSVSDGESVSLQGLSAGTYYAHVYGWNGAENEYALTIDAPSGSVGGDDAYEQNDSGEENDFRETATDLGRLQGSWPEEGSAALVLNDDDWYQFEIGEGGSSDEVRINFEHSEGDIDIVLYDANNTYIDGSYSITDTEAISLDGLAAGTYYLNVYGYAGATNDYYNLEIQAPEEDGNGGGDDRFEQNDTFEDASNLGLLQGQNLIDNGATLTALSNDPDWYRFEITGTGESGHAVAINFEDYWGDLDLELYDEGQNWINGSYSVTDNEIVSLQGLEAGVYYAHVYGYNGAENDYTLTINAPGSTTGQRQDDAFEFNSSGESNNSRETAYDLRDLSGTNTYEDLIIAPPTEEEWEYDWYQFTIGSAGQTDDRVEIRFEDILGDIDLELYDGDGNYLDGSYGVSDEEMVSLAGLAAGTYYVSVYGWNGQSNSDYTLEIEAPGSGNSGSPELGADAYESNDDQASATVVRNSDPIAGLTIHEITTPDGTLTGNDDWFKFTLAEAGDFGDLIRVDGFDHDDGDIDVELYSIDNFDEEGRPTEPLRASRGVGDVETIYLDGLAPDTYYVRVFGYNNATNTSGYQLTVDAPINAQSGGAPETAIAADDFEDNNTQDTAHDFGSRREISENNLTLTPADSETGTPADTDWFQFSPERDGIIEVSLSFDHSEGDVDLRVYDQNPGDSENPLGISEGITNNEWVSFNGTVGNNYWIEVYGYQGVSNPEYSLDVTTGGGGSTIAADRFEPNNSLDTAAQLRYVTGSYDLSLHEAIDEDWFSFTTGESTRDHRISIEFDQNQDLNLELYDAEGTPIEGQDTFGEGGLEGISLGGLAANTEYLARVSGTTAANYNLNLNAPEAPDPEQGGSGDEWTIMVYIAADNNLEGAGIVDINEMEAVNLPDNVNVVVQIDRIGDNQSGGLPEYDTTNGDWTDTRRGLIQHDNNTSQITSSLTSIGETNTGDPAALTEFIQWGAENYAAENYAVVVWDHGGGRSGVAWDDTDGHDNLSLSEVTTAIQDAALENLNLVGFDACLQGLIEQAYELHDLTEVVVASQETEPGDGWDYTGWLQRVADGGGRLSPEEMGTAVVESYGEFYADYPWGGLQTQSAIRTVGSEEEDTTGLDELNTAIDEFVGAVLDNATQDDWNAIVQARSAATQFYVSEERDLGTFMDGIAERLPEDNPIGDAASQVSSNLNGAVIGQVNLPDVSGLSIYLPPVTGGSFDSSYSAENYRFVADTRWDEFLQAFAGRDRGEARSRSQRINADYAETNDISGNTTSNLNNDSPNLAFNLGRLAGPDHEFSDLSLDSSSDVDWYRFEMPGTGTDSDSIQINSEESGDLTLELYQADANGSIARDESDQPIQLDTTSGEESLNLSLAGREGGTYFVKVSGDANPEYTLEVDAPAFLRGGVVEIQPDYLEGAQGSTDNDRRAKAHDLGELGEDQSIRIPGLSIGAGDVDWFAVTPTRIPERYPNAITIEYDPTDGNLLLELYDAEGDPLDLDVVTGSFGKSISFPETNDTVYIRVAGEGGNTNPNYELNISRRELDIDGDGELNPFNDGAMIFNYLNLNGNNDGLLSDRLEAQTSGENRIFSDELLDYLEGAEHTMLDVDGDGSINPFSDGAMIFNYLNLNGNNDDLLDQRLEQLVENNDNARRTTVSALRQFLDIHLPSDSENRFQSSTQSEESSTEDEVIEAEAEEVGESEEATEPETRQSQEPEEPEEVAEAESEESDEPEAEELAESETPEESEGAEEVTEAESEESDTEESEASETPEASEESEEVAEAESEESDAEESEASETPEASEESETADEVDEVDSLTGESNSSDEVSETAEDEAEDSLANASESQETDGSEEANFIAGSSEDLSGVTVIPTEDAIAPDPEEGDSSNLEDISDEEDVLLTDEDDSLF